MSLPEAQLLDFPCRHTRQQRPDLTQMPCAWPGCSGGYPADTVLLKDRINPPFTLTYERRVTGGGTGPLRYFWRVQESTQPKVRSPDGKKGS